MPDERVNTIRRNLKQARSLVMQSARLADEIHNSRTHQRLMLSADAIDDAYDSNEGSDEKLRRMEEAWSVDVRREIEAEARRDQMALVDERYEARKVGRESL